MAVRATTDRDAFATLYRAHVGAIGRYIHRRIGDPHRTEDLTAETFLEAMRSLHRFDDQGVPIRYWLYRIALRRIATWLRKQQIRRWLSLDGDPMEPVAISAGDGPVERESREQARRALLTLPRKYQEALSLRYLEGLSLEETAQVLKIPVGTVQSRLARGRDQLRDKLGRTFENR
ncbi:MAG: RNA polymerase sigma factor [Planctomycetes bacterium]|nr:RNA polymerase sigma factor [Planctomycetota bacterium]